MSRHDNINYKAEPWRVGLGVLVALAGIFYFAMYQNTEGAAIMIIALLMAGFIYD